jgi:hypothetical protein
LSNITARPYEVHLSILPIAVSREGVPLRNITGRPYESHLSNSARPVCRELFYGESLLGEWEGTLLKFNKTCL